MRVSVSYFCVLFCLIFGSVHEDRRPPWLQSAMTKVRGESGLGRAAQGAGGWAPVKIAR